MFVYRYVAVSGQNEAHVEQQGIVVARDKLDAFDKLKSRHLTNINLKRVEGWAALIGKLTADIR